MPLALGMVDAGDRGLVSAYGTAYLRACNPPAIGSRIISRTWASPANRLAGRPVYAEHAITLPLYGGMASYPDPRIARNAHPPTSVLIAIAGSARLAFREAALAWNLVSMAAFALSLLIVVRSGTTALRSQACRPDPLALATRSTGTCTSASSPSCWSCW